MSDVAQENEQARQAAAEHVRTVNAAYARLFGLPGERTADGALVLADLERFARFRDTAITRDMQGRYDGGATAYNTGLQDIVKRIHLKIEWSEHGHSSGNAQ